jgi:2-(1,2-epoxy-1,2-dihydrophenyl)acetyl-CoA isomerase
MPMPDVECERTESGVLLVTLNRPDNMNTLGGTILHDFAAAMDEASRDPAVRAVAITGKGRAFSAGADLAAAAAPHDGGTTPPGSILATEVRLASIHAQWAGAAWACPKPTIGLINGPAAGAGLGLALTLDFRIAAESAVFVSAFAKVALSGDNGVTYALAQLLGRSKALEILMLSPRITAAKALELGLVMDVVPDDQLMAAGMEFAERLAAGPTSIFALMKRNLAFAERSTFEQSLDREATGIAIAQSTNDFQSAVAAFLEKRAPTFS